MASRAIAASDAAVPVSRADCRSPATSRIATKAQKDRGDFIGAERRSPDSNQRVAHRAATCAGALAHVGARPHRACERHSDERTCECEHDPPGARAIIFATLAQEPPECAARFR